MPLIERISRVIACKAYGWREGKEFWSDAYVGALAAIKKFDESRGVKFETYASQRIRGAILDELRALDWVPRSIRQKSKDMQKVYTKLENDLGSDQS